MERLTVQLTTELAGRGHPQAVCCLRSRGELAGELPQNVEVFDMSAGRHDWRLPFRLRRLFRRWRPDVVHGLNWNAWPDAAVGAAGLRGVSMVQTFHGFLEYQPLRRRLAARALRRITRRVQVVSSSLADQLFDQFGVPHAETTIVPNGVDVGRFDSGSRWNSCDVVVTGRIRVVTVGSLTPAKDPLLWIRVAEACRATATFEWVGDGPMRGEVEREIDALRLDGDVVLHGRQTDVRPFLANADLYLCTSSREAAPLAVREAMAAGLPVVSTPVGDVENLLESSGAGICTAGHQVAAVSDRIRAMAELPSRDRSYLGLRGIAYLRECGTLDRMIDAYERSFREVIASRTGELRRVDEMSDRPLPAELGAMG
jgi:glycosyltransferase involved in cell wall biosynthesis